MFGFSLAYLMVFHLLGMFASIPFLMVQVTLKGAYANEVRAKALFAALFWEARIPIELAFRCGEWLIARNQPPKSLLMEVEELRILEKKLGIGPDADQDSAQDPEVEPLKRSSVPAEKVVEPPPRTSHKGGLVFAPDHSIIVQRGASNYEALGWEPMPGEGIEIHRGPDFDPVSGYQINLLAGQTDAGPVRATPEEFQQFASDLERRIRRALRVPPARVKSVPPWTTTFRSVENRRKRKGNYSDYSPT